LKGKRLTDGGRREDYPLDNSRDNIYYHSASQGDWP
jgi:hypothetical protein